MLTVDSSKKISIIMALYNTEDYLRETVESVLCQSYPNFELIIVDDCSSDGSFLIATSLAKLDSRISAYRTSKNFGGPAGPRNVGLKYATGDYIAFLDSDDVWPVNKLEIQLRIMYEQGLDFSSGKKINFSGDPPMRAISNSRYSCDGNSYFRLLIKNFVYTSTVMAKKELFHSQRFEESPEYKAVEDYKMWLKVHEDNPQIKSAIISLPLMNYRIHGSSISRGKWKQALKVLSILGEENSSHGLSFMAIPIFFATYVYFSLVEMVKQRTYYRYMLRNTISS